MNVHRHKLGFWHLIACGRPRAFRLSAWLGLLAVAFNIFAIPFLPGALPPAKIEAEQASQALAAAIGVPASSLVLCLTPGSEFNGGGSSGKEDNHGDSHSSVCQWCMPLLHADQALPITLTQAEPHFVNCASHYFLHEAVALSKHLGTASPRGPPTS